MRGMPGHFVEISCRFDVSRLGIELSDCIRSGSFVSGTGNELLRSDKVDSARSLVDCIRDAGTEKPHSRGIEKVMSARLIRAFNIIDVIVSLHGHILRQCPINSS